MREPIITSDPEVGTILITQEGVERGEQQRIEVTAAMVPRLLSQLFTAAVCNGNGQPFPPREVNRKAMN